VGRVLFDRGRGRTRKENYIGLCRSTDRGHTWGQLEEVLRYDDQACLFSEVFIHDGCITIFVQTHGGYFEDWCVWTITSEDNCHAWSAPKAFAPMRRRAFLWNRYITSWGEWILPFQTYDTADDPSLSPCKDGSIQRAYNGVLISADAGQTWISSNRIGPTRLWAENNVVELSDGTLVMLIRTGTGWLHRSVSKDRGRTWIDPSPTDIPNPGTRFRLFRLSDGQIVLLHNPNPATSHPNSKRQALCNRNPLALWISEDDMRTWGYRRVLTDFPGMLAYPDGVVDKKEEYIQFAFDYNRHDVIYWGAKLPAP